MREISRSISVPRWLRSVTLAAAAALLLITAPAQRADAVSLIAPGGTPAAMTASDALIQVRDGHGGGGFHGGGFHGGGFHGGWHRGGFRYGGFHRFGAYRFVHFHRFHHRRFFYGCYYPYYGYYHHPYCRITYYGPRRVCRWHRWYYRRYW